MDADTGYVRPPNVTDRSLTDIDVLSFAFLAVFASVTSNVPVAPSGIVMPFVPSTDEASVAVNLSPTLLVFVQTSEFERRLSDVPADAVAALDRPQAVLVLAAGGEHGLVAVENEVREKISTRAVSEHWTYEQTICVGALQRGKLQGLIGSKPLLLPGRHVLNLVAVLACAYLGVTFVGYGDYLEQLTYLIFLKMADEYSQPPHNRKVGIPTEFNWQSLRAKRGAELEAQSLRLLQLQPHP